MKSGRIFPAPSDPKGSPEAIGQSEAFLDFQEKISMVAKVDRPILIMGERGTGKELVAARLHYLSNRWQSPLVTLNCAALSPSLLESELFGHEAGAFTGATHRRPGRFETANRGTLFLDEIGLIPMEVQEKILRVVEYGTFERVGSSQPVEVDVRIVGATNANLPLLAAEGKFKVDLLDRLSFEVLFVPPLRQRLGDIPLLARHFAARMAVELGRHESPEFTDRALATLEGYPWPGNVRELKNAIERAVYRCEDKTISHVDFNPFATHPTAVTTSPKTPTAAATPQLGTEAPQASLPESVRQFEIAAIKKALERARFNQRKAAEGLGVTYHQFRVYYRKYKKLLDDDDSKGS